MLKKLILQKSWIILLIVLLIWTRASSVGDVSNEQVEPNEKEMVVQLQHFAFHQLFY